MTDYTSDDYMVVWLAARDEHRRALTGLDVLEELEDGRDALAALLREPHPSALMVGRLVCSAIAARLDRLADRALDDSRPWSGNDALARAVRELDEREAA